MLKKIGLLLLLPLLAIPTFACTSFFLHKDGKMAFGRNYDWVTATGVVHTNARGSVKCSLPMDDGASIEWTSLYGSVTFNQYGKEFPTGGMNEKGLVVELMWLSESRFPDPDERPTLSVLQWIQYQLDLCSTVDEVIATDEKIRIVSNGTPQHYLVSDANGRAATIEFIDGKMKVHSGNTLPYPVLANSPYSESIQAVKQADSEKAPAWRNNSLNRFYTACSMVRDFQTSKSEKPLVDYAFTILGKVAQGSFTKWSIVYDVSDKKIHFKTSLYKDVKIIDLKKIDFSCSNKDLSYNMNQSGNGAVHTFFISYSNEENKKMIRQAFSESKTELDVPESAQDAMAGIAAKTQCR